MSFTEKVKTRQLEIVDQIVTHPFYTQAAEGGLDTENLKVFTQKFKDFIQQDHIYVVEFRKVFGTMSEKETDPVHKAYFKRRSEGQSANKLFEHYYKLFEFGPSTSPPFRANAQYIDYLQETAKQKPVFEAIAATYPCWYIWYLIGEHAKEIGDFSDNNPFAEFCRHIATDWNGERFVEMRNTVDSYWASLNGDQDKEELMLQAYDASVQHEFNFVDENNSLL